MSKSDGMSSPRTRGPSVVVPKTGRKPKSRAAAKPGTRDEWSNDTGSRLAPGRQSHEQVSAKAAKKITKPVRTGDSASRIHDEIRQRILSLALSPGAPIDEAALVREFGKSRTPVREALVRLAS